MKAPPAHPPIANSSRQPHAGWWGALLLCSVSLSALFTQLHLPAAVLMGSMVVAIAFSISDIHLRVPPLLFMAAQGVLGCLMARSLQPEALTRVLHDWPVFAGFTLLVLGASAALGYLLARRHILPGTTAVWGLAPGAASAMVIMADAYGADTRLVALMQYLRVVMVTLLASLVSTLWAHHSAAPHIQVDWLAWNSTRHILLTMALAACGVVLALRWRVPAGAMVMPLLVGIVAQTQGWLTVELPPPLLATAYTVLGWTIGLRFNRPILLHAWKALPHVLSAILMLIAMGLMLAASLHWLGGLDPLTAYLATSPGGADSVAVIAASAAVDAGFVMAMQLARFAAVLMAGPRLFSWVASRAANTLSRR